MAFARRLAILPGGLGGLGSSIGKKLRQQGVRLAILYAPFEAARRDQLLEEGYGGSSVNDIDTYECDITSPDSVQSAFLSLQKDMIAPDSSTWTESAFPSILINTAGYVSLSDMESTPPEETMKHLTTNVFGPMLCSQAFANLLLCRVESRGPSAAGQDRQHFFPGGTRGATPARCVLRLQSRGSRGITANTVSPTVAWTALGQKAWGEDSVRETFLKNIPTGKFALPDEVADAVVFLCQDSSGMINGADIRVDGGFTIR
ncbi:uncharacterized protein N7482_009904 [Penicillium canariense]|uniref:Uncharacterized protein n=1 Tax=Penicillium canariense TaxID=189055 RepID=A0A9W9LFE1_9EURO|nr:uncharacterized protein N7482_009904 [Penicillium canariense]KAJ5153426.1 hypothetical protein N7482_009904 [Penicillium canariense]